MSAARHPPSRVSQPSSKRPTPLARFANWLLAAVAPLANHTDLLFALTTALASLTALWLAMWLQLDAPFWAASTVLITAQTSRSQSLLKGVNRMIGTVVGTIMGVALIAMAPQGWERYLLLHTLWVALCTGVSCLLRDQQSYAAALSGYTALIVAVDSFGKPQDAFAVAVSRGSSVFLGVAIFVAVTQVLSPSVDAPNLRAALTKLIEAGLALVGRLLRGEAGALEVARFMPEVSRVDGLIENGATAAFWLKPRKAALRGAVLALVDTIMAAERLRRHLEPAAAAALASICTNRSSLPVLVPSSPAESTFIRNLAVARGGIALLQRKGPRVPIHRVRRSLDYNMPLALRGALRTVLGMGSACALWLVTRWPSGSSFVLVVGILCCLFASRPSPALATRRFGASTLMTAAFAFWIGFFVLPDVSGFTMLALVLFPFLFVGALGIRSKRFASYITPMNFFLMTMIGIQNVMTYNMQSFFNSVEALASGAIYASLWFTLVPPAPPSVATMRLKRLVTHADTAHLRTAGPRFRQAQRLGDLMPRLKDDEAAAIMETVVRRWPAQPRGSVPSGSGRKAHG